MRRQILAAAAIAAAALTLPAAAPAATLPAGSTAILSGTPSLFAALPAPAGYSGISPTAVSADGRYVAFVSTSDGLAGDDDDRVANIYVKDRATGGVTLASRRSGAGGAAAGADCYEPAISDDGTHVAMTCLGSLDPADTNGALDVYVRALGAATTTLASRAGGLGPVGNGISFRPALSANGERVAFSSQANNLDPTPLNGQHVFVRRLGGGNDTTMVSRAADGTPVEGKDPSIDDDGGRVAFVTAAAAAAGDDNLVDDVYVRDTVAATTVLASRAPQAGAAGNGPSGTPALAGDGSAVAFESAATNFDTGEDTDPESDVYWRALTGPATGQNTALVSINAAGDKGFDSTAPSIDRSGAVVGFISRATALDPADSGDSADAYVKNVMTNTLAVATRADGDAGVVANADASVVAVSGDGTKAAAEIAHGITADADPRLGTVIMRDLSAGPQRTTSVPRPAGSAPFVTLGGSAQRVALSADGRYAAFASDAPGLGLPAGSENGVFVRDRVTGAVVYASRADGPSGAPFPYVEARVAISDDGRRVAFAAAAGGSGLRIWVRDIATGQTILASRADGAGGVAASGDSDLPALDADGSRVAFQTTADNLGDGDGDALEDVHVRDLASGRTLLASRADGAAGAKGDGAGERPDISADGTRVAFVSAAKNLGDGDADDIADVHLRDLAAGTTRLVSAVPGGAKANARSIGASIDGAGTRVAFTTAATNLPGSASDELKVLVRDLGAGTLVLASRADGAQGAAAGDEAFDASISRDGGYVAFSSPAANLGGGGPAGVTQAYRRDLARGRTLLASRRGGATGAAARQPAYATDITRAGGCVGFVTADALYGPPSEHPQAYLRALRADCATTDPAGGDGGGQQAGDRVAPVLSRVRLSRTRFRVARAATPLAAAVRRGTVLRLVASEPAALALRIDRLRTGARRAGTLTRQIAAGPARIRLSGRIGERRLRPGRYRLTVRARDAAGNGSAPVRLRFRIVRG